MNFDSLNKKISLIELSIFMQYIVFVLGLINIITNNEFTLLVTIAQIVLLLTILFCITVNTLYRRKAIESADLSFFRIYINKFDEVHFFSCEKWKSLIEIFMKLLRYEMSDVEVFLVDSQKKFNNILEVPLYFRIKANYLFYKFDMEGLERLVVEIEAISIKGYSSKSVKKNEKVKLLNLCNYFLLVLSGDDKIQSVIKENHGSAPDISTLFLLSIFDCVSGQRESFEEKKKEILAYEDEYIYTKIMEQYGFDEISTKLINSSKRSEE